MNALWPRCCSSRRSPFLRQHALLVLVVPLLLPPVLLLPPSTSATAAINASRACADGSSFATSFATFTAHLLLPSACAVASVVKAAWLEDNSCAGETSGTAAAL